MNNAEIKKPLEKASPKLLITIIADEPKVFDYERWEKAVVKYLSKPKFYRADTYSSLKEALDVWAHTKEIKRAHADAIAKKDNSKEFCIRAGQSEPYYQKFCSLHGNVNERCYKCVIEAKDSNLSPDIKKQEDAIRADEREKQVFLNIYSNMPSAAREEVIVIIEGKPFSWNASYLEIRNDTELGRKILDKLSKMKLI